MTEDQITTLLMCARIAVNDNAITEDDYAELSDALWKTLDDEDLNDDEYAIAYAVRELDNDDVVIELAFARGFGPYPDDKPAQDWLNALEAEAKRRKLEA